ncbi:MAG TPA: class I SAM-dependent methyltransferase [Actinomycetota bacterium]|nr:class I SAM-dependent methyltransferase [Actinomycetota bacterium]
MTVPLGRRYGPEHLRVFTPEERDRFRTDVPIDESTAWELLYRWEPELYDRLVAGERVHPGIWEVFPTRVGRALEVGAGTGRLTLELARRCEEVLAVEPAEPMRTILRSRAEADGLGDRVRVEPGFFDDLPAPDGWADVVCSLSSFTPDPSHGGEPGLEEMERVCRPGGIIVLVWPYDRAWLEARGFTYRSFPGEMRLELRSPEEAVELARIFYPHALAEVEALGSASVPYEILGINPPRDVAFKVK